MLRGSPAETAWPHGDAEARDDRAGERLVLGGLEHVRAEVVRVVESSARRTRPLRRRASDSRRRTTASPPCSCSSAASNAVAERRLGGADRVGLRRAEAERERDGACRRRLERRRAPSARRCRSLASVYDGVSACDASSCGRARRSASRRSRSTPRANEPSSAAIDRLRVVAVGRVRRRDRVGGDEHGMPGRGVDRRGVGAAVARPAAAVAVHGRVEADVEPRAGLAGCGFGVNVDLHQHARCGAGSVT